MKGYRIILLNKFGTVKKLVLYISQLCSKKCGGGGGTMAPHFRRWSRAWPPLSPVPCSPTLPPPGPMAPPVSVPLPPVPLSPAPVPCSPCSPCSPRPPRPPCPLFRHHCHVFHLTALSGWSGPLCTVNANECANSPCYPGGGQCIDAVNSFSCQCNPGFSGLHKKPFPNFYFFI